MQSSKIVCTVTNDLVYDQRMQRICTSLTNAGYDVLLVGRKRKQSHELHQKPFKQKRLNCWFDKGKLFYIEYNIRLFIFLMFVKTDLFCAIDLDTILPTYFTSVLRNKKRVYDAHELFCEMEEIVRRPRIYKVWKKIETFCVPKFKHGYTIGNYYALEFKNMYNVDYEIVRNATVYDENNFSSNPTANYILYQGAVNEGRGFEYLIPAMQGINMPLVICGHGNFFEQTKQLISQYNLENKITLKGYINPTELKQYTQNAYCGITLFEKESKSNYLSMANRFFDYMHAGIPQICNNYPEYKKVNSEFEIALLIDKLSIESIANGLNTLINNTELHYSLKTNTKPCAKKYCWQEEEKKLIQFYKKIFENHE